MRRWVGLVTLACTLSALGYAVAYRYASSVRLGAAPARLEARWPTEEQWLVDSIARDLVEMARFAATGRPVQTADSDVAVTPGPGSGLPLAVTASIGPGRDVRDEIALGTFVWAPEEYAGFARRLLGAVGVVPRPLSAPDPNLGDLLRLLTELRPEVIERVNQRVSLALAASFADPAHHDAAALVLAAFALREDAGEYSDGRATLSRITAHLAFAGALRQDALPTPAGRYARLTLLVLAGRGADATAALEAPETDDTAAMQAWRRALRRRLIEDTRTDTDPQTWLERRELYRALVRAVDADSALEYGERLSLGPGTDRWRLASERLSVEAGNVLLADAIDREVDEARTVWMLAKGRSIDVDELPRALNEPAERCVGRDGPRALGWGTWAAFLQRHLINALWIADHHARSMLAMGQAADEALRQNEDRFGRLGLYPLIEVRIELAARRRPKRYNDLVTLVATRPELANAYQWWSMGLPVRYEVIERGMPELAPWFSAGAHRGTTFDAWGRRYACVLPRDVAGMRAFHALSPQDFDVTFARVELEYEGKGAVRDIERVFGARAEYDIRVLDRLVAPAARDLSALGPILERKCAMVAGQCFDYADYLVEVGQPERAAAAYQRGIDLSADRVEASHHSRWLMNYYLDRGETDRARAIATEAAETGAGSGFVTLSRFLERTGDYKGAEALLERMRERYGHRPQTPDEKEKSKDGPQDGDELAAFYHRMAHVRKRPGYDARFRELSGNAFPDGVERADLRAFSGAPTDGAFVLQTWDFAERNGVKAGDVIVSLDGYRVRSRRQYSLIRVFKDDAAMAVVVFRHPRYVEVKLRSPWRFLGVDMRSHQTSSPPPAPPSPAARPAS